MKRIIPAICLLGLYPWAASAQDLPRFNGEYTCTGECTGDEIKRIEQFDNKLICSNSLDDFRNGYITSRYTFEGCWDMHATVSADGQTIEWPNMRWTKKSR